MYMIKYGYAAMIPKKAKIVSFGFWEKATPTKAKLCEKKHETNIITGHISIVPLGARRAINSEQYRFSLQVL